MIYDIIKRVFTYLGFSKKHNAQHKNYIYKMTYTGIKIYNHQTLKYFKDIGGWREKNGSAPKIGSAQIGPSRTTFENNEITG